MVSSAGGSTVPQHSALTDTDTSVSVRYSTRTHSVHVTTLHCPSPRPATPLIGISECSGGVALWRHTASPPPPPAARGRARRRSGVFGSASRRPSSRTVNTLPPPLPLRTVPYQWKMCGILLPRSFRFKGPNTNSLENNPIFIGPGIVSLRKTNKR